LFEGSKKAKDTSSVIKSPHSTGHHILDYHPFAFRHRSSTPTLTDDGDLILTILETTDYEYWIAELWKDFLIEPTPYLVVSAMVYLGFILLLVKYHTIMWHFATFLLHFLPWDEDDGFS
jgi:hypothetical protein